QPSHHAGHDGRGGGRLHHRHHADQPRHPGSDHVHHLGRHPVPGGHAMTRRLRWLAAGLWLGLGPVAVVGASHPGLGRLEVWPDPAVPGGILEVRGVSLPADEAITVVLASPAGETVLGTGITDALGAFQAALVLPRELAAGAYILRATPASR